MAVRIEKGAAETTLFVASAAQIFYATGKNIRSDNNQCGHVSEEVRVKYTAQKKSPRSFGLFITAIVSDIKIQFSFSSS